MVIALAFFKTIFTRSLAMNQAHGLIIAEVYGTRCASARIRRSLSEGWPEGDAPSPEVSRRSGNSRMAAVRFERAIQRRARRASRTRLFREAVGNESFSGRRTKPPPPRRLFARPGAWLRPQHIHP